MRKNYGRFNLESDDNRNWPTIVAALAVGFALGVTIMLVITLL